MAERVSDEVRVLLARRRLPARALCDVLGKSQQSISERMRAAKPWSLADLDALARFFGVDANALLPELGKQGVKMCAAWDSNPEPTD